jgi:hypothetical protein
MSNLIPLALSDITFSAAAAHGPLDRREPCRFATWLAAFSPLRRIHLRPLLKQLPEQRDLFRRWHVKVLRSKVMPGNGGDLGVELLRATTPTDDVTALGFAFLLDHEGAHMSSIGCRGVFGPLYFDRDDFTAALDDEIHFRSVFSTHVEEVALAQVAQAFKARFRPIVNVTL